MTYYKCNYTKNLKYIVKLFSINIWVTANIVAWWICIVTHRFTRFLSELFCYIQLYYFCWLHKENWKLLKSSSKNYDILQLILCTIIYIRLYIFCTGLPSYRMKLFIHLWTLHGIIQIKSFKGLEKVYTLFGIYSKARLQTSKDENFW